MAFKKAAAFALALIGLGIPASAQQRTPSVFTVSDVRVETEAADSVEAKKLAARVAEMRAFRHLIGRITDFRSQARIPELAPEEVERLVAGIDIRGEGVSATSYVATFGVTFSERAIVSLLSRYQIIPILDRGPEVLIVPVYIEEGAAVTSDRNPWRGALTALDLSHALVPAKVAPARGDLTAAIANAYLANPSAGIETLKAQYHVTGLLLAVAEVTGRDAITLKLAGSDALGSVSLQRKIKSREAGDEPLIRTAARLAFETVQERWKLTRGSYVPASGEPSASNANGFAGGGSSSLQITAQFSGLKEWQAIRTRLQNIPGIQNWDLRSVNPRSAEISFDFPGGAERLTGMAASQGLSVENGPEGLVVKTR